MMKDFKVSKWAPEFGTSDSYKSETEGKETSILQISSSELHSEFFSSVTKLYSKHKQFTISLQIIQLKYRITELESQLEGPWLRDFKDNRFSLIDDLHYHREKNTSALTVIDRDHNSQYCKNAVSL
ncbi:hypothetical protein O181_038012 [Austropuccinia psidii MF-1]|uniref:Uncharacterized protein n=1 Tax=Austropuccinia psidii MF-1 TaxID=1389203 RepID=A0A9Q3HBH4_9BASI|nr:hypothetical protein [Austropuccinia psidii MF-1]